MKEQHLKPATVLLTACIMFPTWTVLAAPTDAGTVLRDSQQVERKLPEHQVPNVTVDQEFKPPMVNDKGFKMFVKNYRISGQDVFANDELAKLLIPYSNKQMTMTGLQEATALITKYFRDRGYFVAQAYLPAQEINEGTVEVTVLIGQCGDILLKNQTHVPDNIIMEQLKAIKTGSYISTAMMERAALLASDLPGVAVKTTLTPGKFPGTTDIIVEAKPKGEVWQGSVSGNNWGNRLTGYNQTTMNVTLNNPLEKGDSFAAGISTTGKDQQTGNIAYHIPLGEGSTFNVGYSKVYYELGKEMSSLDAFGTAYTNHADLTYALRRSRESNYSLQLGYDYKRMEDKIDSQSQNTEKWSHATSVGLIGDSTDSMLGGGTNSYNLIWYTGGINGRTNTSTGLTTGQWHKTTYSIMRQQYVKERLSLFLAMSGQLANTNLDSSEKFSLGGANGVRAYPSGEASGDEAWLGTAELSYTMPAANRGGMWQLTTFYDTGCSHIEKHQVTPGENHRSLSGAGIGINYTMPGSYMIKANYAWRLGNETPQSDSTFGKGHLWLQGVKYF